MLLLTREVLVVCKFATFSNHIFFTNRRKDGKWQARIGRIGERRDTKDIYLGTFGEWSAVIYHVYLVGFPKVFYQLESNCQLMQLSLIEIDIGLQKLKKRQQKLMTLQRSSFGVFMQSPTLTLVITVKMVWEN
jgi:hypothetical protein